MKDTTSFILIIESFLIINPSLLFSNVSLTEFILKRLGDSLSPQ